MLGLTGAKNRAKRTDKSLFRDPRPAGWGCTIPDAVVQLAGWKAFDIPGKNRTLILSDVHIPFHSPEALELALDYGREKKCTLILLNGDIADHYSISRWQTDPGLRDFPGEVLAIKKFLKGLRKNFPKARIIYKHGNHEERYSVFMQHKCPEFLGLEQFEWGNVFSLPENKVELVHQKRPITLGKLNVIHGHEYPGGISAPVNPARGLFLRGKCHAICGHLHQSSQHSEKTLEQSVVSTWSTGCLCYDSKTEVLTQRGWVPFPDVREWDNVAEFNPKTSGITHRRPLAMQRFWYTGNMARFIGPRVDLLVTPEHKMLYSRSDSKLKVRDAQYVASLTKPHIPIAGYAQSSDSITKDEADLMAWVVAEGTVDTSNGQPRVSIYQKRSDGLGRLSTLLERSEYDQPSCSKDSRNGVFQFRFNASASRSLVASLDHNCKRLPRALLMSSAEVLRSAYETLIITDGHRNKKGTDYFATIHQGLANDFQELCCKIGYSCRIKHETQTTKYKKNAKLYRCLVRKFSQAVATRCDLVPYDGMVFDITTTDGFFVVRRNGLVSISGNCDLNPDYRPMNNWNHGFAFAETAADGSFEVQNLRVIDGKVY
jgi:predicted phosphodiesterase